MPATAHALLLIDDDVELAGLLAQLFVRDGMVLAHAADGAGGLAAFDRAAAKPDLVLLDLMLPDIGGIDVFRALRSRSATLPIVMLTARGDPVDRVVGLELGADDYVAKPFDPRELVARVRAVLRRATAFQGRPAGAVEAAPRRELGAGVALDVATRTLVVGDASVPLTTLEYRLLAAFADRPGETLSRDRLSEAAQVGNYRPLERAVDVQIGRLRKKLRDADARAEWIATERGEGYRWSPPASFAVARE